MYKSRFEAEEDVWTHVPVREAKQASVLLRARSRRRKSAFSSVKLCFLGHCYFCLWLFGRPVTDTEAAPSSETPGARASVSDASLIRVGALISAFPPLSASPSVRSASEPTRRLHTWTASVSPPPRFRVNSCKFACIWWIPGYFKWVKENPQLRSLVISESHCEYVINVLPRQFPWVGNGRLYFQQASS